MCSKEDIIYWLSKLPEGARVGIDVTQCLNHMNETGGETSVCVGPYLDPEEDAANERELSGENGRFESRKPSAKSLIDQVLKG